MFAAKIIGQCFIGEANSSEEGFPHRAFTLSKKVRNDPIVNNYVLAIDMTELSILD